MGTGRRWSLLLVPGGVAAGHVLGYSAADLVGPPPEAAGGHGYLQVLFRLAVPFTLAVLARAFLSGTRAELPPVRYRALATAQVAVFAAVEVYEHAAVGLGPDRSLREASFWLGVGAQLLVAVALVWLTAWMRRVGEIVAGTARRHPGTRAAGPRPLRSLVGVVAAVPVGSLSRRGPPRALVM